MVDERPPPACGQVWEVDGSSWMVIAVVDGLVFVGHQVPVDLDEWVQLGGAIVAGPGSPWEPRVKR